MCSFRPFLYMTCKAQQVWGSAKEQKKRGGDGREENRRQGRHQKKTFLLLFSHSLFLPIPFLSLLHSSTTLRRRPYRLWMGAFTPTLFHSFQFSSSSSHLLPLLFNECYAKALKICHLLPRIPISLESLGNFSYCFNGTNFEIFAKIIKNYGTAKGENKNTFSVELKGSRRGTICLLNLSLALL